MNTSQNPISRTQIRRQLNEMVDYHLFKSASWPADDAEVRAFLRTLKKLGLQEAVPGQKDMSRFTTLGIDCAAPLASYFIGAHDLIEIPMMLETEGLIDEQEADAFYSSPEDQDENVLHQVEVLVRRAHRRFCAIKNECVTAAKSQSTGALK
jgi:hypothetical protein